jgi:hypothetical protein
MSRRIDPSTPDNTNHEQRHTKVRPSRRTPRREAPSLTSELLKHLGVSLLILLVGGIIGIADFWVNTLGPVPPVFHMLLQLSEVSLLAIGLASLSRLLRDLFPDGGAGGRPARPVLAPVPIETDCPICAHEKRTNPRRRSG